MPETKARYYAFTENFAIARRLYGYDSFQSRPLY